MLAGFTLQSRVNAVSSKGMEESSREELDEERISAIEGDHRNKKKWWKKVPEKKDPEVVPAVKPLSVPNERLESKKRMHTMMNEMKGLLEFNRKPEVDRVTVKCFSSQEMGHYAAECTMEKPV